MGGLGVPGCLRGSPNVLEHLQVFHRSMGVSGGSPDVSRVNGPLGGVPEYLRGLQIFRGGVLGVSGGPQPPPLRVPPGCHLVRSSLVLRHALGVPAALGGRELGHADLPVAGAHGERGVPAVGQELGLGETERKGGWKDFQHQVLGQTGEFRWLIPTMKQPDPPTALRCFYRIVRPQSGASHTRGTPDGPPVPSSPGRRCSCGRSRSPAPAAAAASPKPQP